LQLKQFDGELTEQVAQVLSQGLQTPRESRYEPTGQEQVPEAESKIRPFLHVVHPFEAELIQVVQVLWQLTQSPREFITKLFAQTQAPFCRLAFVLHERHPFGVPLLLTQVLQVMWQLEHMPSVPIVVAREGHSHLLTLRMAVVSQARQLVAYGPLQFRQVGWQSRQFPKVSIYLPLWHKQVLVIWRTA
jgi:hypothetical protein